MNGLWILTAACALLLASCASPVTYPATYSTNGDDISGFGPGRIDKTVAAGRIKNTIARDTTGCSTLEGLEKYIMHPVAIAPRGCIDLESGDKVIGPLEVQVVMVGKSDPEPHRYARIEVPGKGKVWTYYAHLTK
jgi:hypothetical protein